MATTRCSKPPGRARRLAAAMVATSVLFGCGAGDAVRAERPEVQHEEATVGTTVNLCPTFEFTLFLPRQIHAGERASAAAYATDADSLDSTLAYLWTATSGEFARPTGPLTDYECADAGPQVVSVTTSDLEGCENRVDFDVTCER